MFNCLPPVHLTSTNLTSGSHKGQQLATVNILAVICFRILLRILAILRILVVKRCSVLISRSQTVLEI